MKVKRLSKKQQKKLLDYAMENCKMVSFTENLDQWPERNETVRRIIFGNDSLIPLQLFKENVFQVIKDIANKYKSNKQIQEAVIDDEWKKWHEEMIPTMTESDFEGWAEGAIVDCLKWYYFYYQIEKFLKENRKYLVYKRERFWTKKKKDFQIFLKNIPSLINWN